MTKDLLGILETVLKAVGRRTINANRKSAPWWTEECKSARLDYKLAITENERKLRAKLFRATVASAKREYWKKEVEKMKTSAEAFKLSKWATPRQARIPPLILNEGKLISDQAERATILRDCLLVRNQAGNDLPPCTLAGNGKIPWTEELTEKEVRSCTIGCGNTCAGVDGISLELLAACWESIATHVTQIFRACLRLSHHPPSFKRAEVVFFFQNQDGTLHQLKVGGRSLSYPVPEKAWKDSLPKDCPTLP